MQLGYVVESASTSSALSGGGGSGGGGVSSGKGAMGGMGAGGMGGGEEQVQTTPRVIAGSLKREVVRGVAACKTASACWTGEGVWTWGRNGGQLGKLSFFLHDAMDVLCFG